MPNTFPIPLEIVYVILLFALFVIPKFLQRFRIPSAITSLCLGAIAGMGFGVFAEDATVQLLSSLGIVALFLFAGLEVDAEELRLEYRVISQHLIIRLLALVAVALLISELLSLSVRSAALVSLALLTPSTGFILDSLSVLGLSKQEEFWIKTKAIAAELLALVVLLFTLQSTSITRLAVSLLILGGMIAILPLVFRTFAKHIVPFAPKSEFAFLLMLALVCAFITRELGVYYLVGAFVVGMAARRFRQSLPAFASDEMLHAVELFAAFFVPFYFFHAGLGLEREDFIWHSLLTGIIFLIVMIPLRIGLTAVHRQFALNEDVAQSLRITIPMLPTLVFTLVIAEILKDRFQVPQYIFGGLIVYTIGNTLIPGLFFRQSQADYDVPHLKPLKKKSAQV
jgi:Kef-type K+ transport system membrane component KefB